MRMVKVQGSGISVIGRPTDKAGVRLGWMAVLALVLVTPVLGAADGPLAEAEILGQADTRIQKYRTTEVTLRVVDQNKPLPAGSRIRISQTRHAFLFGSNIFALGRSGDERLNGEYARRFAELWNYATLPFYWWTYEREQGKPDHARTEALVRWCREHDIVCKGHPLAWNFVDPPWLSKDPAKALDLQLGRIGRDMTRFRNGIGYWDVVNEATEYDRAGCKKNAPALTKAIEEMGMPAYLRRTFEAARAADPKAVLVINDYVTNPTFGEKVLTKLVDDAGKPLYDVIGIQCHQHGRAWTAKETWDICERFAGFGKPLHFTEATLLSGAPGWELGAKGKPWDSTPEGEKRQAEEVARFYTVLFSHPAVEAITWWDFTDYKAWQGAPAGLLREDMTPKPAYEELMKRIKGTWWTKTVATVGDNGEVAFRGFLGDYEVILAQLGGVSDRPLSGNFSIGKTTREPVEVTLAFIP